MTSACARRHPVSSLQLASWVQSANFVVTGALAVGIRKMGVGAWLIGAVDLVYVDSGVFTTDPVSAGVLFAIFFVLTNAVSAQTPGLVDFGGLFQRLTITTGFTWLTVFGAAMLVNGRDLG